MADERILEIVLRARDDASKVVESIGNGIDKTEKEIQSLSKSLTIAGGIITGFGVAGAAMLKSWVDKASDAQVETVKFNTILSQVADSMKTTTMVIKGNSGELDNNSKAIGDQIETKKRQVEMLKLSGKGHEDEITAIKASIDALKLSQLQIENTTVVKDKLVTVTNKNALSFQQLSKATADVAKEYIKLGFDDEETSTVFAKDLSITQDLTQAKKMLAASADLARYKSIGLAEAGQAMQLAMMGNTRILKALGIEVEDNATKMQVLAAVQAKVAGQAKAFSGTDKGVDARLAVDISNLQEALGDRLIPTLTDAKMKIAELVEKFLELDPRILDLVVKVTTFGTAFALVTGPLLLFLGMLPTLTAGLTILTTTALGPILLAVVALGAAAYLLINNWQQIQPMLQPVFDWFLLMWNSIKQNLNEFITANLPLFQSAWDGFTKAVSYGMQATYAMWSTLWPSMQQIFKGVWEIIRGVAQVAWGVVEGIITVGLALLSGDWGKAWKGMQTAFADVMEGVKRIAQGLWDSIVGIFRGGLNAIIGQINGFIGAINKARPGTIGFSIPSFDEGGWVPQDTLAMVHRGEFVMSRDMLAGRQAAPAFATTNNNNSSINLGPVYVNDYADVDTLVQRLGFYYQSAGNI